MTWLTDWLKEIPLSAVLKERVASLEADAKKNEAERKEKEAQTQAAHAKALLEAEKSKVASDMRADQAEARARDLQLQFDNATAEVKRLNEQLEQKEREKRHLEPEAEKMLILISGERYILKENLQRAMGISPTLYEYCWHRILAEFRMIESAGDVYRDSWRLSQLGRTYLLKNKLVT